MSDVNPSTADAPLEGMDEGDRAYTVDTDYWQRLSSNAYDEYDDLEAKAEEWEARYYGRLRGGRGKKAPANRLMRIEFPADNTPLYAPDPHVHSSAAPVAVKTQAASPPARTIPPFNAAHTYDIARKLNMQFEASEGSVIRVKTVAGSDVDALVSAYEHMLHTLDDPQYHSRYGYHSGEGHHSSFPFGASVPSYFANVGGQSIYWRKVLSIAGLRNLIQYGPTIYTQLEKTLFSGRPSDYSGNVGLNLMRTMTGNVVDLDTTVLRCSDRPTLEVINASNKHKGLPTFNSNAEFGASAQAESIAINCATPLLEGFVAHFKLSPSEASARNVNVSQVVRPVPQSFDNSTRGHTALWHYINAGQDSFHVNVPSMDDVVGALLRAPFACVEHYCALHVQYGSNPAVLRSKMNDFFEYCVVDSCFNMKWKAVEEFGDHLAHDGTVVDVLQKVQASNQGIFTSEFFDADNEAHDNEIAEMVRLVADTKGRDRTGRLRTIQPADVRAWVLAAADGKPIQI